MKLRDTAIAATTRNILDVIPGVQEQVLHPGGGLGILRSIPAGQLEQRAYSLAFQSLL